MRLSKFTLFLSAYTILSSYFMLEVWNAWRALFGVKRLTLFFVALCLWAAAAATLYKKIKTGFGIRKIGLVCLICIWGFLFAWRQPYFSEKAHVLEFALLGWLTMRDLTKQGGCRKKDILLAFIFVAIIASLEEGFQKFLPWRVCEVRDIITDTLGGMLGIIMFVI